MSKKKQTGLQKNVKPRVHKELDGFDIKINSFGEIVTSFDMDKINEFLNKNVIGMMFLGGMNCQMKISPMKRRIWIST
jgi:hypothetical protein